MVTFVHFDFGFGFWRGFWWKGKEGHGDEREERSCYLSLGDGMGWDGMAFDFDSSFWLVCWLDGMEFGGTSLF